MAAYAASDNGVFVRHCKAASNHLYTDAYSSGVWPAVCSYSMCNGVFEVTKFGDG